MNKLLNFTYSIIRRFFGNHNNQTYIRNNQYYDKYGMLHMKRYLDYLDGCDGYNSYGSTIFDNSILEYLNSLIRKSLKNCQVQDMIARS